MIHAPRETSSGREGTRERRMPGLEGGAGDREVVVGLEPGGAGREAVDEVPGRSCSR